MVLLICAAFHVQGGTHASALSTLRWYMRSPAQICVVRHKCFYFSRNIGSVTPKIIYFYYLKNTFIGLKYPKNILLNFENKITVGHATCVYGLLTTTQRPDQFSCFHDLTKYILDALIIYMIFFWVALTDVSAKTKPLV